MIETGIVSKVKIQDVLSNQLPNFIRDESDKTVDFLKQYYISQEYQGGPVDIVDNLDTYLNVNSLVPEVIVDSSTTVGITTIGDEIIKVNSTKGFPNQYGLLKIDNEVITYTGITTNTFIGCKRGFSGITSYHSDTNKEDLVFSTSSAAEHENLSTVQNLSSLFLKEFYKKFKKTFLPGLEETDFQSKLDVGTFIGEARSLYQTKGTEESFRILFNILYGITPRILNLEEKLVKPSFANYIRRRVCVAELLSGNPLQLEGQTLLKGLTGQTLFRSDLDSNINASISEIEPFERRNSGVSGITTYFKIGLFVGYDESADVKNDFVVVPTTKSLETVSVGASVISVDSTVGFGTTGTIISGVNTITYTDKTVNQFLNCSWVYPSGVEEPILPIQNLRSNITYFGFENGDLSKKVTLRLTGVMSDFDQLKKVDVDEGEKFSVRGLGDNVENPKENKTFKEIFCNSWIYNTSSSYFIDNISASKYTLLSPIDDSSLKKGDFVELVDSRDNRVILPTGTNSFASVKSVDTSGSENSVELDGEPYKESKLQEIGINPSDFRNYKLRKVINKASVDTSSVPLKFGNNKIISDIQNVYIDRDSENAYVASNSLPSFIDNTNTERSKKINISTKNISVNLSNTNALSGATEENDVFSTINFETKVPFITGDKLFYSYTNGDGLVGLETGSYYVEVLNDGGEEKSIKLYNAPTNIDGGKNLTFTRSSTSGVINFVLFSQKSSVIDAQKLYKKFPLKQNISDGNKESTQVGQTGMLLNGVEISNYKSNDKVYFGPLKNIQILNSGENYDVINLPSVTVSAGLGTTALVQPVISGKVKEVIVDPQNFDISEVISAEVTGGNGNGCVLEPIIGERFRSIFFDSRSDEISSSGGISTSDNRITFKEKHFLVEQGTPTTVPIIYDSNFNRGIGIGVTQNSLVNNSIFYPRFINDKTITIHSFESDALSGINTIDLNGNYASGDHSFKVGLRNTLIDVKVIEEGDGYTNRKLRISPIGVSTGSNLLTFKDHGFNSGDVVEYSTDGTPITGLTTSTGITTTTNQYKIIKVNDNSFRVSDIGIAGTITDNYDRGKFVEFSSTGVGYQIFSYPEIKVNIEINDVGIGTTSINLVPVVRGSMEQAYLYESGTGYGSTIFNNHKKPNIVVKNGKNGSLKPIIVNGKINTININFGGEEYFSPPDLNVIDPTGAGAGAKLRPVIKNNKIDDVIIVSAGIGYSTDTSIQVKSAGSNAFFDSEVRSLTVNKFEKYGIEKIKSDEYQLIEDSDNNLKYSLIGYSTSLLGSSDLIGWAYDGNPIYGPYGSIDPQSKSSLNTKLRSAYALKPENTYDRPAFADGFFVEDYVYSPLNSTDLDEYNGRFEVTEEFPNGAYVYHATFGNGQTPAFPYFIGNSFKSKSIEDNFKNINQNNFDFESGTVLRNTFPYKIGDKSASNDFIIETGEFRNQLLEIEKISSGSVNGFNIISGGSDYKVNQFLNFDETGTSGKGLISLVSRLDGKSISKIETTVEKNLNSVVTWSDKQISVFTPNNHNFSTNDVVVISGLSTDISSLNNSFKVKVDKFTSSTISTMTSMPVGVTTEIFVSDIPKTVSIGSSITIGAETLRILNIYENLNVLTVRRLSGVAAHSEGTSVNYLTNKLTFDKDLPIFDSKVNRKIYFNANKSVGFGTTGGTELSKTFLFADKNITRNIPVKQIYLEGHNLQTNQRIKFTKPTSLNFSISTDSGATSFEIPETLFVVNKSVNTIGIKTQIDSSEVSFISISPSGADNNDNFLFETQNNQITCKVEKIKTDVTTFTSHGLETGDNISLTVNPSLTVGIGTSSAVRVSRDTLSDNILINPIGFTSLGINTSRNIINIQSHELQTGDKIKYSASLLPEGLENKNYFIYKVDDDNLKLCDTFTDTQQKIPNIVGIASTGGNLQSISLINPRVTSIKNNNLVFDLSDSSLIGYQFKLFYDNKFKNEFTSVSGISSEFTLKSSGSIGSAGAKITVGFSTFLPNILYYNLEKSGTISTSDDEVKNHSEIFFDDTIYNNDYTVTRIGINSFSIFLNEVPENLSYSATDCEILKYDTNSKNTSGAINKINILSGGSNYKKLPKFIGIGGTSTGTGAVISPVSDSIGNIEKVRVVNEGFEYSSDKTLEPESLIASSVTITNADSLGIVSVTNGGSNYIEAPNIIIVDTETGLKLNKGFLEPVMLENSILSINIVETPLGLPATPVTIRATENTNGIVITDVISNNTGIFTCRLVTPPPQFPNDPFAVNDRVFIEGIQKIETVGPITEFTSDGEANSSRSQGTYTITNANGSLNGTGADFTVVVSATGTPTITLVSGGSGYTANETITIADSSLGSGGAPPLTLTVTSISVEGTGFNSSDYGYKLLKVTKFDAIVNPSAQAEVTIDVTEFGTNIKTGFAVENVQTFSTIINESDYPKFTVVQNQSKFDVGELIKVNDKETDLEIVEQSPAKLKIFGNDNLNIGDKITGSVSDSECEVRNFFKNITRLKTDFSVLKELGWDDNIGKLNDDFQVLPDNDYHQNMSYSVQSPIEWDTMKTIVNNVVHTSGMKNFADVGISSSSEAGISTDTETNINVIVDLFGEKRVDEIKNIDTVKDVDVVGDTSRFISFDNIRLSDYIACKTNDVLSIDNLSPQFSNSQGDPNDFLDLFEFSNDSSTESFNDILIVTQSSPAGKLEMTNLLTMSNGVENILVEKLNLINSKNGITHESDHFIDYKLNNSFTLGKNTVRFAPNTDFNLSNDTDYDLKIFKSEFNTNSIGVGTTSIGPINLNSRIQECPVGITTNIISVPVNKFESLYATIYVFDTVSKEMNLIESFVSHNSADTFITESYFNGKNTSFSLEKLGNVSSNINSGNLILSFQNTQSNLLKLKSKVVGLGTTGVSNGIYRFKSTGQLDTSERTSLYSGISTSIVGISTIETLDAGLFNAVKSIVEVSIGSSKAIHEVLFVHDGVDAYSQQSDFLSITKDFNSNYDPSSGLGTFSANISGSNFILKFHPDHVSGVSTVVSLNHCFYNQVDVTNTPNDLVYGTTSESNSVKLYSSRLGSRVANTEFTPKVNQIPLFGKVFNPALTTTLNPVTGKFTIQNHFFRDNEELIYEPKSTFIGVGATPLQYELSGVGIHQLPSRVFVVNSDENNFFISTVRAGTSVTFTSLGEGNAHEFNMAKANEKSVIILDDVAQYPLIRTDCTHTLDSNLNSQVGLTTTIVHLSGISTISSNDILKIDNEFLEVVNVGFATTGGGVVGASGTFKTVEVTRAFVGTSATTHSDGTTVTRFKGSYHINGRKLFFTKPPRGDISKTKNENDLPIATTKFSGRVYLRNDYSTNTIFDDVSDQFTGIKSDFTLKVGGANTIGIGTTGGSGVLFVNGIFQSPSTQFNPNKNFKIIESGSGATGVTTVVFTGITSENGSVFISNNINTNQLPRGGVPISIGNTVNGKGYAPLVGANVKALFNGSGAITSVVGTAYSASDLGIQTAAYDNLTGIMTVTTTNEHPFTGGARDFVLLDNFTFTTPYSIRTNALEVVSIAATNIFRVSVGKTTGITTYASGGNIYPVNPDLTFGSGYNGIVSIGVTVQDPGYEHRFISANPNAISNSLTPTNATYNPVTGELRLTIPNHGKNTNDTITIATGSVFFSCSKDNYQTVHPYPRYSDPAAGTSLTVTKLNDDIISVNVGVNVGSGAQISAVAGIGGTAIFTINQGGSGYKDPQIFVSQPSYSNLSIRGISRLGVGQTTDTGSELKLTSIVTPITGTGSTAFEVSEYEIVKSGFGFKEGDVVEPVGLVTSKNFNQLASRSRVTIDKIYNDNFALWQFGDFDYIDSIKSLQDGVRTSFLIKVNNQLVSFEVDNDSINSQTNLENIFLVTVNGVVQDPKIAYNIVGGNIINFTEPPVEEDDVSILFYRGTAEVDSEVNLAEKITIEEGDVVKIKGNSQVEEQNNRTVFSLNTSQKLETNPYRGLGINDTISRPLNLLKQKEDKVINQVVISKKRSSIEPRITPVAKIISDVTSSSSDRDLFVDNLDLFDYETSTTNLSLQIVNQNSNNFVKAEATALVSIAGTISGFTINNAGAGYTVAPTVKLINPPVNIKNTFKENVNSQTITTVGVGTTATATALINSAGTVTAINVNNPGFGYTNTAAPQVLISSPAKIKEISEDLVTVTGDTLDIFHDNGTVTGIGTTIFNGKLGIKFTLDSEKLTTFNSTSLMNVGNPIYIYDTQVGSGVVSINTGGSDTDIVGIGTTFVDNIYVVSSVSVTGVPNVGIITALVKSDTVHSGLNLTGAGIGKYSIGKISNFTRASSGRIAIGVTGLTVGLSTALGISTFPTLKRTGGDKTFEQTGALIPE